MTAEQKETQKANQVPIRPSTLIGDELQREQQDDNASPDAGKVRSNPVIEDIGYALPDPERDGPLPDEKDRAS